MTHEDRADRPQTRSVETQTVVEAVARRDFDRLAAALHDDVHLCALLPGGVREWHGRAGVNEAFSGWFDDFEGYELVDAEVGEAGARLQLAWRLRVRKARAEDRPLLVQQHLYADVDADGRICRLSLLCSGFWREPVHG